MKHLPSVFGGKKSKGKATISGDGSNGALEVQLSVSQLKEPQLSAALPGDADVGVVEVGGKPKQKASGGGKKGGGSSSGLIRNPLYPAYEKVVRQLKEKGNGDAGNKVAPTSSDAENDGPNWESSTAAAENKKTEERLAKLIERKEAEFEQLKGKLEQEFSTFFTGVKEELGKIARGELDEEAEGANGGGEEGLKEAAGPSHSGSRRPTLLQKLTFGLFGGRPYPATAEEKLPVELEEAETELDGAAGAGPSGETEGEEGQDGAEKPSEDGGEESKEPAAEEETAEEGEKTEDPMAGVPIDVPNLDGC